MPRGVSKTPWPRPWWFRRPSRCVSMHLVLIYHCNPAYLYLTRSQFHLPPPPPPHFQSISVPLPPTPILPLVQCYAFHDKVEVSLHSDKLQAALLDTPSYVFPTYFCAFPNNYTASYNLHIPFPKPLYLRTKQFHPFIKISYKDLKKDVPF
jgi:hypothetical protein